MLIRTIFLPSQSSPCLRRHRSSILLPSSPLPSTCTLHNALRHIFDSPSRTAPSTTFYVRYALQTPLPHSSRPTNPPHPLIWIPRNWLTLPSRPRLASSSQLHRRSLRPRTNSWCRCPPSPARLSAPMMCDSPPCPRAQRRHGTDRVGLYPRLHEPHHPNPSLLNLAPRVKARPFLLDNSHQ